MLNLILVGLFGWLVLAIVAALGMGTLIRMNREMEDRQVAATYVAGWKHPLSH